MTRAEEREALLSAVERLPLAVVTFDGRGNVRIMNRAAVEVFSREGLPRDLLTSRPSHPLSQILRDAFEGRVAERIVTLASGQSYAVELSERSHKDGDRLVMMLLRKRLSPQPGSGENFSAFDLTARECDVARALIAGRNSHEIADSLAISPETLKSHLANMMRKTSTRSRAELVALLLRGREESD